MNESAPGVFNDNVCALYLGNSGDDLGLVGVDPLEALAPYDFSFEVIRESAGGGGRRPHGIGRGR